MPAPTNRARGFDLAIVASVAAFARLVIVLWAAPRFPPAGDGVYYVKLAERIASGQGYTWPWPDGTATYAAHYPVGLPFLLSVIFRIAGPTMWGAMLLNAVFGVAASVAGWALLRDRGRGIALIGGILLAIHPALLPYTAAIMTEGISGALLVLALWIARKSTPPQQRELPWSRVVAAGLLLGLATLIRPQTLVFAPVLGFLMSNELRSRLMKSAAVLAVTLACCLPWTARNCVRMNSCALVSVNAGWNLLIGEQTTNGSWQEIRVPTECREIWDEAGKDACFKRAAQIQIADHPIHWASGMARKLFVTFDYYGGAPWYLQSSNDSAFTMRAKEILGTIETGFVRVLLLAACLAFARSRPGAQKLLPFIAAACLFARYGWVAHVILGAEFVRTKDITSRFTGWVVLGTAATHAVFFGAGRYGLVPAPLMTISACQVIWDALRAPANRLH